jgi:hypothetical protein
MSDIQHMHNTARVLIWKVAAASTGTVLRYRSQVLSVLPFLQIAAGGAGAYVLGRWIGELVRSHWL